MKVIAKNSNDDFKSEKGYGYIKPMRSKISYYGYPGSDYGRIGSCEIWINNTIPQWEMGSFGDGNLSDDIYSFYACMLHEMGHTLGLGDIEGKLITSIMC